MELHRNLNFPSSAAKPSNVGRRTFLKTSAVALAAACATPASGFFSGSDRIRIGLVGCGGRGIGAAMDCVGAAKGVEIVALGDLFKAPIDTARAELQKRVPAEAYRVTDATCFVGFDAYQHVLACDIDVVLLATPAQFRPAQLKAAIQAGKHAFIEKPVAVDPVGVRTILASAQLASEKNLAIVAGTQRRHDVRYREVIKRIHDGAIGELVAAQCYWMRSGLWVRQRQPGWSDMEWQIRNYIYFTWLGGDCIVSSGIHTIDIVNWAFGAPPTSAIGVGGRQVHTTPAYGNVFDHFAVEYAYAGDVRTLVISREWTGCASRIGDRIVGAKGVAYPDRGIIKGEKPFRCRASCNPYVEEQAALIQSIRNGKPLNEGRAVAETTLTAIMGRMSAYTGQEVTWDWALNKSQLDLTPPKVELGPFPMPPVAQPGVTPLV